MKKIIIALMLACLLLASDSGQAFAKGRKTDESYIKGYKYNTVTKTRKVYLGEFWITHYCPCARCCGAGGGKVTASGTKPTAGRTVGVNPKLIPYGTKLKVGDYSGYVAEDTGGGIGWRHLDIFCNSHAEALNAGVGFKKVWAIQKYKKRVKVPIYKKLKKGEGMIKGRGKQ